MDVVRSKAYLAHVRQHPCIICGTTLGLQAHHLRMVKSVGSGTKVGDQWTVPLCWECHHTLHNSGDEPTWWDLKGVDPVEWARNAWNQYNEQ